MTDRSCLRIVATVALLGWPCCVVAQATAERAYDVRDLIVHIPDFTDAPQLGVSDPNGPQAAHKAKTKTQEELTRDVVGLARSFAGLPADAIRVQQGQMVVRAAPDAQRLVAAAVEELRERAKAQVIVEARAFRPDEDALRRLGADAPALALKLKMAAVRGGGAAGTPLTAAEVETLRGLDGVITAPRITLFAGQRAYVLTSTQRAFVAALAPKKNADGAAADELGPQVRTVSAGIVLDARATPSRDGRFVALAARVTLSTLHGMEDVPAPGLPPERGLTVQRPDYEIEVADVHAVAPEGAFLLFGATEARRPNAAPDAEPSNPVFVVVSATVIGQDRARRDAIN